MKFSVVSISPCWLIALLFAVVIFLSGGPLFAQQLVEEEILLDEAPPPAANGRLVTGDFKKFLFATYDQYSFSSHPFSQLTGDSEFDEGYGASGGSSEIGSVDSDKDSSFVQKAIHALPSFGIEKGWIVGLPFPKGISVGFDYSHVTLSDFDSLAQAPSDTTLQEFEIDIYYFAIPVRFYGRDPGKKGFNYFLGFSVGLLEGNLLSRGTGANGEDETISFSASGVGATRIGFEVAGKSFGFRYEMMLVNAEAVTFQSNPFSGQSTVTEIDMSGTLIRLGGYYKFD